MNRTAEQAPANVYTPMMPLKSPLSRLLLVDRRANSFFFLSIMAETLLPPVL